MRRKSLTEEQKQKTLEMYSRGLSDRSIAKEIESVHYLVGRYRNSKGLPSLHGKKPLIKVDDKHGICSKCGDIKLLREFTVNRRGKQYEYSLSYCFECRKKQAIKAINRSPEVYLGYLTTRLKSKCISRNIAFTLSVEDVIECWRKQEGKCFYSGVPMVLQQGEGYNRYRCSIDKVIPEKGYLPDNIVLCAQKANTVKNDLTIIELKSWIPGWYSRIIKKFPELEIP